MNRVRNFIAVLLCSILLANVLVGTANAQTAFNPTPGPTFNNPYGTAAQKRRNVTKLVRSIDAVPRGGSIRMAIFGVSDDTFADALISARNRGVSVKLVVQSTSNRHRSLTRLINAFGQNKTTNNFVFMCQYSCMSSDPGSIMHVKLYLFSQVSSTPYVSMIGSGNPSIHNIYQSWNDMYTIVNNKALYDANNKYFNDLLRDHDNSAYAWTATNGNLSVRYLPQSPFDPVYYDGLLRSVTCSGAAAGYGTNGKTAIRVNVYFWGGDMISTARLLRGLHDQGCDVQIILNHTDYHVNPNVVAELLNASGPHGAIPVYASEPLRSHMKYLTISGVVNGNPQTGRVYTGSANWTHNSMSNDNDMILRISDQNTVLKYNANFAYIRDHNTTLVK